MQRKGKVARVAGKDLILRKRVPNNFFEFDHVWQKVTVIQGGMLRQKEQPNF